MVDKENLFDFSFEEIGIENIPVDEEIIQEHVLREAIRKLIQEQNL